MNVDFIILKIYIDLWAIHNACIKHKSKAMRVRLVTPGKCMKCTQNDVLPGVTVPETLEKVGMMAKGIHIWDYLNLGPRCYGLSIPASDRTLSRFGGLYFF